MEGEPTGFSGSRSTLVAAIIAVVGTIGLIAAAMSLTGGRDASTTSDTPGTNALPVEQVAARPDCPVSGTENVRGPLAGVTLPCLGAPGHGAIPVGAALAGKPAVINVWAWNCGPCRQEIPHLQQWAKNNPDVTVVGVQASTSEGRGAAFLNDIDTDFPSYQDSYDILGPALALPRVVPVTIVLRADGSVATIYPQAFSSVAEIDTAVRDALATAPGTSSTGAAL